MAHSQKDNFSLNIGYSKYSEGASNDVEYFGTRLMFEGQFLHHRIFQPGISIGAARNILNGSGIYVPYNASLTVQLLPLFIESDLRFKLYSKTEFGGNVWATKFFTTHNWEYGFGGGAAMQVSKRLGAFTEYTYGQYVWDDKNKFEFGLQLSF